MAAKHKDELGDRIKGDYEHRSRYFLPRRSYTIIRLDGKCFHSYTKGCKRPYDLDLMADMDTAAIELCEQVGGARLAYVQSDEISLILTDFDGPQTEAWFDNNLQKMCSISASIATATFNQKRLLRTLAETVPPAVEDAVNAPTSSRNIGVARLLTNFAQIKPAHFDSRVFQIPDLVEVCNYLIWRQQDARRNSISMTAQAHFAHKELQGKSSDQMLNMLIAQKGIDWNDQPAGFTRGRCIVREATIKDVDYIDKRTGEYKSISGVERHIWRSVEPPLFLQDREWLLSKIPQLNGK